MGATWRRRVPFQKKGGAPSAARSKAASRPGFKFRFNARPADARNEGNSSSQASIRTTTGCPLSTRRAGLDWAYVVQVSHR